jgi:hypothetical protein
MLWAPAGHALRSTYAFSQQGAKNGKTTDGSSGFDIEKMSSMGRLAHLAITGRLERALAKARAKVSGGKSILADQPFSRNLETDNAADEAGDDDGPAGGQAQPSIAVDSTGQHIVIGLNDTRGFGLNPASVSGFMYSDDGGQTFTDGGQLPVTTGISFIGASAYPQIFGDPEVKYLGGSTFVYFSIIAVNFGASAPAQTLGFHRSTDFGHTWTGPYEIPPATNPNGLLNGESVDAADKPFADVDPDTGRVLVSWSNFTPFTISGVEISAAFSDNILSGSPTWSARRIIAATALDGQSSIPRFAGNGSPNVYMSWRRFIGTNTNNTGRLPDSPWTTRRGATKATSTSSIRTMI